jgi:hypothetical protein
MGVVSELAQRRPRLFGGTVAATTGSLGDICAQRIAHKSDPDGPQEINPSRVFAMASFCATFASVVYVPFYRALDRFHGPARTLKNVLYKTAWNQLALSPFVDVPVYFAWSSYLDDDPDPWRRFRCRRLSRPRCVLRAALPRPTALANACAHARRQARVLGRAARHVGRVGARVLLQLQPDAAALPRARRVHSRGHLVLRHVLSEPPKARRTDGRFLPGCRHACACGRQKDRAGKTRQQIVSV